jgi:hypothetical protein
MDAERADYADNEPPPSWWSLRGLVWPAVAAFAVVDAILLLVSLRSGHWVLR